MRGSRIQKRGLRRAAVALALVGVVAGAAPAPGATVSVKATKRSWNPASKTVAKGTKVVWKNPSSTDHNLYAYGKGWTKRAQLPEGARTAFTFKKAGRFKYRCTLHSKLSNGRCEGMCGKIVVR